MNRRTEPDPNSRPVFISEAALARRWHHSVRSLQRWRCTGRGPTYLRLGRRIVYRLEEIERFEAEAQAASEGRS